MRDVKEARAIALLEAANTVSTDAFQPPAIELAEPARRRRPRLAVALAAAAAAAVLLIPGSGDDDVLARAAQAVSGPETIFIEARKVEFGEVVTRELSWTTGDRRRQLVYEPDGTLETEVVSGPDGVAITRDGQTQHLPGGVITELNGDPVTLLARAREGRDGLKVVGEDTVEGKPVYRLEGRHVLGTVRIVVSGETFLPISATIGLSTYVYDRIEKLSPPRSRTAAGGASPARRSGGTPGGP
jgi:hypothetical protein